VCLGDAAAVGDQDEGRRGRAAPYGVLRLLIAVLPLPVRLRSARTTCDAQEDHRSAFGETVRLRFEDQTDSCVVRHAQEIEHVIEFGHESHP
jgi:hypothetical protein